MPEALPTDFADARDLRQRRARRRAADPPVRPPAGRAAGLRPRPRQGPRDDRRPGLYGAGGYQKTPLEETLPVDMGVRDRQKQPDVALVVVIDQSGSMDACHCNSFNGGMGGGEPGSAACARSTSARRRSCGPRRRMTERDELGVVSLQRAGALGRQDPAARRRRATCRARSPASSRSARRTSSRASSRRSSRSRAPTATRRHIILLTDGWSTLRPVRRDPRADEGGRDHALDGRRGRRLEPVPRGAREAGRRPVLRRGEPGEHPGHLPQGDPAGLRPADRRGAVLPDPDVAPRRSCAGSTRACRGCAATTGRRPSPPRRPCS